MSRRRDQAFRDQPSLFGSRRRSVVVQKIPGVTTGREIERRLTRPEHPETSREAAERLCDSGHLTENAADALAIVRAYPGSTGYELDTMREHGDAGRIRKRLSDLAAGGFIERGSARRCKTSGSKCVTWWPKGKVPTTEDETMRSGDVMPDQLIGDDVRMDDRKEPVQVGRAYMIGGRRVQCFEDEFGNLCIQHIHRIGVCVMGSQPQRVAELPKHVTVTRVVE